MKHDEYLKLYENFVKIRENSFSSLDDRIMKFSTGILILSITFLEKIGSPTTPYMFILIVGSWVCFGVVIITHLFSFFSAKKDMDLKINELNAEYANSLKKIIYYDDNSISNNKAENSCFFEKLTNVMNLSSLLSFVFGFILLLIYVGIVQYKNYNIINQVQVLAPKESIMSQDLKKAVVVNPEDVEIIKGQTAATRPIPNPNTKMEKLSSSQQSINKNTTKKGK